MRILRSNPKAYEAIKSQTTTINGIDYNIGLFLELKDDKDNFGIIPWSIIEEFSYIDDINYAGLIGHIKITNISNILNPIIENSDKFYIGFYAWNPYTDYEENIYFSISSSKLINNETTSSSTSYILNIVEAFLIEGASRNINAMGLATGDIGSPLQNNTLRITDRLQITIPVSIEPMDLKSKNLHDLIQFSYNLLQMDLRISGSDTSGSTENLFLVATESTSRIIDIDKYSMEYFKNNYPTITVGEIIYKNIDDKTTITSLLDTINKNVYFPRVVENNGRASKVNLLLGDIGTARSENISYIKTNNKKIYENNNVIGERQITLRSLKDTFMACFQNNEVYESIFDQTKEKFPTNMPKFSFATPSFTYNMQVFPVNTDLINDEWCDCIVAPINQPDAFTTSLYTFNDLIKDFNDNYLYNKTTSNILISPLISRGVTRKAPPFNDNTLNFAVSSKLIKTMFTLNSSIQLSLPGNTFRKANEIIYIDKNLTSVKNDKDGTQTTFSEFLNSNYYFTTRVVHNFRGQEYINELFLTSFCNPNPAE